MLSKIKQNDIVGKNPKKKVLFVITQSEWGGAQRFLYNIVTYLDPEKYEILVATGSDGGGQFLKALKKRRIETQVIASLKRSINPFYDLRAVGEIKKLIKKFQPDTLFLNSSKTGIVGSLASKKFMNLNVVYRIGGWSFNDPLSWPIRQFYIWAEKYTAKFKDVIIINNSHDFEQAKQLKIIPRQKLELVYNGIDPYKLEFLNKDEAKIKLHESFPGKPGNFLHARLIVGTIANFYKTKGLEYLIKAAELVEKRYSINDLVFIIIGDGPERKSLELKIKEKGLENKVLLSGKLPDAYKYLPAFDIFVLPSVKEGFAWTILEAMSAKVPVIATNVGAAPEIIENKNNGLLVSPRGADELASALNSLANSDDMRREFAIQAHQTILHKFSFNKMMGQIESLI